MTRLSVNLNKVALIRNARGGNLPDLLKVAKDCEVFGAEGITVHPRPDGRHIRYEDVINLKREIGTEFNIEGNPTQHFIDLVLDIKPAQVTLVPDEPNQLTSDHGWNTRKFKDYLAEIISVFKNSGIRTSIFIDPVTDMIKFAAKTDTDRIELYTEQFARDYPINPGSAIASYMTAAELAHSLGLGINAGHDLNLDNLAYFNQKINHLEEVSIGHALICDALYYGLENTIQMYLSKLSDK